MKRSVVLVPIAVGAIVINTMPIWLAELASAPQVSDTLAGALGSSVLLAAALTCAFGFRYLAPGVARLAVPLAFALLAFSGDASPVFLAVICVTLGVALGVVTQQALSRMSADSDVLRGVSSALASGLCASLLVYLALPVLQIQALWVLSIMTLILLVVRPHGTQTSLPLKAGLSSLPFGYLPFFGMMGAYWSFIEIFARSLGDDNSAAIWLLFSLVASALASALAGRLPARLWQRVGTLALIAASLTGATSYIAASPLVLGVSVLANGFFLFLFFPLYLSSQGDRAPQAMGLYLMGFALGGLIGAGLIGLGGYGALALAILLSPLAVLAYPSSRAAS